MRQVFDQISAAGFDVKGVEACCVAKSARGRRRVYAGTGDGALAAFECRADTPLAQKAGGYEFVQTDILRKFSSRDSKAVTQLEVFEQHGLLIALVDGVVIAYDTVALRATAHVRDTKCTSFAAHAPSRTLVLFQKKRAKVYAWQRGGALRDARKEFALQETPLRAVCVSSRACILACKKHYDVLDLDAPSDAQDVKRGFGAAAFTGAAFSKADDHNCCRKLIDAVSGAGVALVVPGAQHRADRERLLTSTSSRGTLFDVATLCAPGFFGGVASTDPVAPLEERLQWSSAPSDCRRVSAFIVALVNSGTTVQVHFAPTLAHVQTLELGGFSKVDKTKLCAGEAAFGLCGALDDSAPRPDAAPRGDAFGAAATDFLRDSLKPRPAAFAGDDQVFVLGDAKATLLRMVSVERQVSALVDAACYEDALALVALADGEDGAGIDVEAIEERFAYALYARGDFEGAATHWLRASTPPAAVAQLFPSMRPTDVGAEPRPVEASQKGSPEKDSPEKRQALRNPPQLRGAALSRAAAAVTRYYEAYRAKYAPGESAKSKAVSGKRRAPALAVPEATRVLVDTMLVSCRLQCAPARLGDVIALLKSRVQYCEVEAVAPLLAAGGAAYAEALLWLYRSKGAHQRALSLLVEDRCCAAKAWDVSKFRRWKARYVRALWFSSDSKHAPLALGAAMALFAVAPALGLAALTGHEISSSVDSVRENDVSDPDDADPLSFEQGGAGTPAQDVVNWMKALELGPPEDSKGNPKLWVAPSFFHAAAEAPAGDADAMLLRLPLTLDSGTAVAVAYLEHLVSTGESLAVLHNELGYLLLEGVLKARKATDGERGSAAANKVESAYRGRLRYLLKTSTRYHAAHVVSWLPDDFVLEKALVLARLERHYDVLRVYAVELRDDALAEAYCDEVWRRATARRASVSARRGAGDSGQRETDADDADDAADGAADDALDVYLILAKCYYQGRGANEGQKAALDLLTRHMARVDPMKAVSDVLPKNAKCAGDIADFISRLVRFWESERRAADVEHQLLRMEFVNLKYELTQQQLRQQSKMSAVPELARLGRVRRSLPPVSLSEGDAPGRAEPYAVACTRHLFESHVVLQFHVTNNSPMQHLQNVRVRVESLGDADLYAHDAEVPLKALPFRSTGSCYVVFRTYPTVGVVTTAFACELRFSVVSTSDSSGGTSYLEEILLRDLELATGDA